MTTVMIPQAAAAGPSSETSVRPGVEVRLLTSADEAAVSAMVGRCSRMTLFRRFHSFTDGCAYVRVLFSDRPDLDTLLAWHGGRCIAIGNLADYAHLTADLGVLVEDAWQRRGVGSELVSVLFDRARARGVCRAHADVRGDDQFILSTLRRYGPLTVSVQTGTYSVDIELGPDAPVRHFSNIETNVSPRGESGMPCSTRDPMTPAPRDRRTGPAHSVLPRR